MRKEYREGGKEHLKGAQRAGKKESGMFGRELDMGIPSWDGEPEKAGLVPLKNRFSAQHDVSMSEAMRCVKGHGTSAEINGKRIDRMNDTD